MLTVVCVTRRLSICLGLLLACSITLPASAEVFGSLSNFDVVNDTGRTAHGFEIEIEGISSTDITSVFGSADRWPDMERYGSPTITEYSAGANTPGGVRIVYQATYSDTWSAGTPSGTLPVSPSDSCWPYGAPDYGPNYPCDHFGVSTSVPTPKVNYKWLVEDSPGSSILVPVIATVPNPVWTVTPVPPVNNVPQNPIVNVVIEAPEPVAFEFGEPRWVKVTATGTLEDIAVENLLAEDPVIKKAQTQVQLEWQLIQVDQGKPGSGQIDLTGVKLDEGASGVVYRFEFYEYTGERDPETNEAKPIGSDTPGIEGPDPSDLGEFIVAQNAGINFNGAIPNAPPLPGDNSQTIDWTQSLSGAVGGSIDLAATASSGLQVSYSGTDGICTVNGSALQLVAAGNCTVTASQSGNANYKAATPVQKLFTISKASQTLSWPAVLSGAVGASITLDASASSGLVVSYAGTANICTVSGTKLNLIAAGTCSVTATQAGNANYNSASSVKKSFTVTKGSQTIAWPQLLSGSRGGTILLAATASSGLTVSYTSSTTSICTVSGSTLNLGAVGTCTVSAAQAGNANWNAATPVPKSFTVGLASISQLAGNVDGPGFLNGTGTAARFFAPTGIAIDSSNNLYVTDTGNSVVRKITSAGVVTTLSGAVLTPGAATGTSTSARFNKPTGIAINGSRLVIADTDNQLIRSMTTAGVVSALAGSVGSIGSTNGTGTAARFNRPQGVAVDTSNNAYISDTSNNSIRKITSTGVATTFAGTVGVSGGTNGTGTAATFSGPMGIGRNSTSGDLYVSDSGGQTIRKVTSGAVVSTLAGSFGTSGSTDATGASARFSIPSGATVDSTGNIFVSDASNGTIRKITSAGVVSTFAGTAGAQGSLNGTGAAAMFYKPVGMARDGSNNVFVADPVAHTIRKMTSAGVVTTFAGSPAVVGAYDSTGNAASFRNPSGTAVDAVGDLYVADAGNHIIRKVTSAGVVTTIAGVAGAAGSTDGTGSTARFNSPNGLTIDAAGNLYVADTGNHTIRKITPGGVVTTIAGLAENAGSANAVGTGARFTSPSALVVYNSTPAVLYVADTGNYTIRKIDLATLSVTTLAGSAGITGTANGVGTAALFGLVYGLGVDSTGSNVFVADYSGHTIRRITISTGAVSTFAGTAGARGTTNATGTSARFANPYGLTVDAANTIYVGDYGSCLVRKITTTAVVTTPIGTAGTCKFVSGNAPSTINSPVGLSKFGSNLYFSAGNGVARVLNVP